MWKQQTPQFVHSTIGNPPADFLDGGLFFEDTLATTDEDSENLN